MTSRHGRANSSALVVRRDGAAELVLYGRADPDAVIDRIVLDSDERAVLGELLVLPPGRDETTRNTHHRTWELTEDQP